MDFLGLLFWSCAGSLLCVMAFILFAIMSNEYPEAALLIIASLVIIFLIW